MHVLMNNYELIEILMLCSTKWSYNILTCLTISSKYRTNF